MMRRWLVAGGLLALGLTGCTPAEPGGNEAGTDAADVAQPLDVADVATPVDAADATMPVDTMDAIDVAMPVDAVDAVDVAMPVDAVDAADAPTDDGSCPGSQRRCGLVCVDTDNDVVNCGACGNDCTALPNAAAGATCSAGQCVFTGNNACQPGFAHCGADPGTGCETDLSSPTHCGACTTACNEPTPMCSASGTTYACVSGCSGTTPDRCAGTCVDSRNDVNHCGTACAACTTGDSNAHPTCDSGRCGSACNTGFTDCAGTCVDIQTDNNHCGSCGSVCVGGTCSGGACTCPAGKTLCGNACVSLQTDPNNCGACGYRVLSSAPAGMPGHRDCVLGQPSPGWAPVGNVNAPTVAGSLVTWTGRHFLNIDNTGHNIALYDPTTDTWAATGLTMPYPGGYFSFVAMPDRNQVFVWGAGEATASTVSNRGFLFDDSGQTPTLTALPAAPITRGGPSVSYDGLRVYVLWGFGNTTDDGAYYDLAAGTWTMLSGAGTSTCGSGVEHAGASMALANGLLTAYGGQGTNDTTCASSSLFELDPGTQTWLTPRSTSLGTRAGHVWTTVGDAVFLYAGRGSCQGGTIDRSDAWLVDPRTGPASIASPGPAVEFPFAAFTGRAVVLYGGETNRTVCGGSDAWLAGGFIGTVTPGGSPSIDWHALPTTGQPSGRNSYVGNVPGNAPGLWTGREMIVWGGFDGTTFLNTGARYQPPVGCVCPRLSRVPGTVPDGCTGVTNIADPSCSPL